MSVARSVRLALGGELVPDAVNVAGGAIDPFVRPGIALVEKLAQVLAAVAGHGALTDLEVDVRGELAAYDVSVYRLAALKGYFTNQVTENVSYVNAPLLAEQRGITSRLTTDEESKDYRNTTTLRGALSDGTTVEVSGTLVGHQDGREDHRPERLRHRGADRRPPRRDVLHRPSRDRRGLRQGVRRGRRQHRGHAGRAPKRRRSGAQHHHRRLPGARRGARSSRRRRSTPTRCARSTSSTRRPRVLPWGPGRVVYHSDAGRWFFASSLGRATRHAPTRRTTT